MQGYAGGGKLGGHRRGGGQRHVHGPPRRPQRASASRSKAWSEPPRSATGWTERTVGGFTLDHRVDGSCPGRRTSSDRGVVLRVAVNVEQLLSPSPGGVGRYAAKLVTNLVALGVDVQPVSGPAYP